MQLIKSPPGKIVDGEIIFRRQKRRAETIDIVQLDPKGCGDAQHTRRRDFDDLSGADDLVESAAYRWVVKSPKWWNYIKVLSRKDAMKVAIDMLDRVTDCRPGRAV